MRRGRIKVLAVRKITLFAIPFTLWAMFMLPQAAASLQDLRVGMDIPEISLKTISGETRNFSDLRGDKMTILFFWSTWSKNSRDGLVRMEKLYRQYSGKGLMVVGINVDDQKISGETLAIITEMAEGAKITFPILVDQGLKTFHDLGVIAVPTSVIVDSDRLIKYELSGYPLVGVEEMSDFVVAAMDGNKPGTVTEKTGYQPDRSAVRLYNMGRKSLKSRRMADTAETWFKKSVAADPRFVQPHLSLGKLYLAKGDIPAAKSQFEQSLVKEPENIVALCEMGMIIAEEGKSAQGMALFDRAIKLDAAYTPCYYYRGFVLGKSGKSEEAQQMFEAAMAVNPMDFKIHIYRGRMYEELGLPRKAAEAYREALEKVLHPN